MYVYSGLGPGPPGQWVRLDAPGMSASVNQVGPYHIVDVLAAGGMGETLLAHQLGPAGFGRPVVLKRLLRHLAGDRRYVEKFLAEARLAAQLSHPNIAQVIELREADGDYYLVMEYVEGRSLRHVIDAARARGRTDAFAVTRICADVARGLHYVHGLSQGASAVRLIHRDVSPENILVGFNGTAKLTDFGIAREANSQRTQGSAAGKLPYLAPEVIQSKAIDHRADVYALGVVLFEALTGALPFAATNDGAMLQEILRGEVSPPPELRELLPGPLDSIITRALKTDPEARFPTAEAMARDLERYLRAATEPVGPERVEELMLALFERRPTPPPSPAVNGLATPAPVTGARATRAVTLPPRAAPRRRADEPEMDRDEAPTSASPPRPPRRKPWAALAIAAAVVCLGLVAALAQRGLLGNASPPIATSGEPPAPQRPPTRTDFTEPSPSATKELTATASPPPAVEPTRPAEQAAPPSASRGRQSTSLTAGGQKLSKAAKSTGKGPGSSGTGRTGTVDVRSDPWAAVAVNGVEKGETPLRLQLSAGRHVVTLTCGEGKRAGAKRDVQVDVREGQESVVPATFCRE